MRRLWKQKIPESNKTSIMTTKNILLTCSLILMSTLAYGDSIPEKLGRFIGQFGSGVGKEVSKQTFSNQPQWITIPPRSKEECIKESGNVLNTIYMRCRHGRQEYVRYDANGKKIVLQERPIPLH